jgi:hypothetical protein
MMSAGKHIATNVPKIRLAFTKLKTERENES